jgi:hypothetical protein
MKSAIFLSSFLIIMACTKQNEYIVSEATKSEFTPTIVDGILSFKSTDEAMKAMQFLSKMGQEKRKKWEEANGFYSIRRRVEEGFDAIHKANIAESKVMLNNALEVYSDVIELRDSVYEPKYNICPFDLISNRMGLFITTDFVQKVTPKNIEVYKLIAFDALNHGIEQTPINSYVGLSSISVSKNNGPHQLTAEYYDNPSGCKHDRRVYVQTEVLTLFEPWTHNDEVLGEITYMRGTSGFYAETFGRERNWLCNWSRYSTLLAVRNVTATFYVFQNDQAQSYVPSYIDSLVNTSSTLVPYTFTCADYTTLQDSYEDQIIEPLGHAIINESSIMGTFLNDYSGFISCHFEGSSRGVGLYVNWAVIDY